MNNDMVIDGDDTVEKRKEMVDSINGSIRSGDLDKERLRLIQRYGDNNVWDAEEMSALFTVEGFMAPFVVVVRKSDGKTGTLLFQDIPRFYFFWDPSKDEEAI
jgi:hypothetical protein